MPRVIMRAASLCYCWLIALTGQISAHFPQSTHFEASMTYCDSPLLIALTGHSGSHCPHDTHSLEITYDMVVSPRLPFEWSSAEDDLTPLAIRLPKVFRPVKSSSFLSAENHVLQL